MPDHLPVVIDPWTYEKHPDPKVKWLVLPRNGSVEQDAAAVWLYRLDVEGLPADAMLAKTFSGSAKG